MRIAFYALHYGKEYLGWSMRSIQDAVDEIHVLYTHMPSFGHGSGAKCVETEEELFEAANHFELTKPLRWHRGVWRNEGEHRDAIFPIAQQLGAETMLVVDADEVWMPSSAKAVLDAVEEANSNRRWSAAFCNFWRSFDWVVHDHFRSIRVVDLRHPAGPDGHLSAEQQPDPVYHFGYAQSLAIMNYKWSCHGHQKELRPGWWDRFAGWTPGCDLGDLHPCVNNLWDRAHEASPEVRAALKEIVGDHPNFGKGLIG